MIWWVFWVWSVGDVLGPDWSWSGEWWVILIQNIQVSLQQEAHTNFQVLFWSSWIQRCDRLRFLLNPDRDSHHHTPSHDWWLDDAWWLARSHHSWYGLPSSFAQVSVCLAFGRLLWHGHGYDYCLRIGCRNLAHTRHHPFDLDIKFSVLAMAKIGSRHGNQHGNSFCLSNLPDSPWYSGDRLVSTNPDPAWYRGYTAFVSLSVSHEHGLVGRPFFAGGECLCTSVLKGFGNCNTKKQTITAKIFENIWITNFVGCHPALNCNYVIRTYNAHPGWHSPGFCYPHQRAGFYCSSCGHLFPQCLQWHVRSTARKGEAWWWQSWGSSHVMQARDEFPLKIRGKRNVQLQNLLCQSLA